MLTLVLLASSIAWVAISNVNHFVYVLSRLPYLRFSYMGGRDACIYPYIYTPNIKIFVVEETWKFRCLQQSVLSDINFLFCWLYSFKNFQLWPLKLRWFISRPALLEKEFDYYSGFFVFKTSEIDKYIQIFYTLCPSSRRFQWSRG